jgi:nucleoside-diphosphate-sugar epimerase
MAIDIIGGSGFIGTRLVNQLQDHGHLDLKIVDKAPSGRFPDLHTRADVRRVQELRAALTEGSMIINLAAEHRDDVRPRSLYREVNVDGAENICTVAREKNVNTIVFTSSVAVYGFAPIGTRENGAIAPFNDYGRTKFEAENIFREWQHERPEDRTLVILRPTVVFGEQNRGNVYNLLRQIASGRFLMIGSGRNKKSIAYVENVASFIRYSLNFKPGIHVYNFVDKPDLSMNELVEFTRRALGQSAEIRLRLPFYLAIMIAKGLDVAASLTGRQFPVSAIRIRKFCANSAYETSIAETGFTSPVQLREALERTIHHEFVEAYDDQLLFYSE